MHISIPNRNASLLTALFLLVVSSISGCSGGSVLDDPGVSLPAEPPQRTYSKEVIELNNKAGKMILSDGAEAARLFDQAIAIDPNYDVAIGNKATLLVNQKKYAEAISCFERLAQLRPHSAETYVTWAYCLHSIGQEAESKRRLRFAVAAYNKRLAKEPDDPWILSSRALVGCLFGETERARQEIASVLESDPSFVLGKKLDEAMQSAGGKGDMWDLLFD